MAFDEDYWTDSNGDIHVIYSEANSEILKIPLTPEQELNMAIDDAEGANEATRDV